MHETLNKNVNGYIDIFANGLVKGWAFHKNNGCLPIRIKLGNNDASSEIIEVIAIQYRKDVSDYYKNTKISNCGFNYYNEKLTNHFFEIEMFIENDWISIFEFNKNNKISFKKLNMAMETTSKDQHFLFDKAVKQFKPIINIKNPSLIVVDDFYQDPDKVREFALSQKFEYHPDYHKGKRTNDVFLFDGLKEHFEFHINKSIKKWNQYGVNGCFQYCVGGDQLVYHVDTQQYAAIIFLTPDAPPNTGTSFYRSKYTKERVLNKETNQSNIFKNGYLDSTEFELVDQVGNVYNRLVIFNSQMIHAASCYFGNSKENGRLFQMFFFDLED
jgi:hypothetical protein